MICFKAIYCIWNRARHRDNLSNFPHSVGFGGYFLLVAGDSTICMSCFLMLESKCSRLATSGGTLLIQHCCVVN